MDTFKNKDKILVIIGMITILVMAAISIKGGFLNNTDKNKGTIEDATSTNGISNESDDQLSYKNEGYGFQLDFPESWKGYSVINDSWEGQLISSPEIKFHGSKIIIRHPQWTEEKKWQDIPILIFNKEQWQLVQTENISLGAAPIGPSKLGENDKYVFALPARWIGFTADIGQNEASEIVKTFKVLLE